MGLNITGVDSEDIFKCFRWSFWSRNKNYWKKFIDIFERESKKIGDVKWLGQGTVYPDVIESIWPLVVHQLQLSHNVGGLPEKMKLKVIEPLKKYLDEVRKIGHSLGVKEILQRHPFQVWVSH